MSKPVVTITDGALQGYVEAGIQYLRNSICETAYTGARWQPPVPPDPWAEIREAKNLVRSRFGWAPALNNLVLH